LTLVFPDKAPSRFLVAMRSGPGNLWPDASSSIAGPGADVPWATRRAVQLLGALDSHDHIMRGHSERVRAYAMLIAEEMNLAPHQIDQLSWGAVLHDIGKLEIPTAILNKSSRLTAHEFDVIKQHPATGLRLAASLSDWLGDGYRAIGEHHERWDGGGYPSGLHSDQIALAARIVSVADTFDVMTGSRSYKKPCRPEEARAEIVRCSGTQFDPAVVRAFLNISVGRLRLVAGPLSWIAQLPALAWVPFAQAGAAAAALVTAAAIGGSALSFGTTADTTTPQPSAHQQPLHASAPPGLDATTSVPGRVDTSSTIGKPMATTPAQPNTTAADTAPPPTPTAPPPNQLGTTAPPLQLPPPTTPPAVPATIPTTVPITIPTIATTPTVPTSVLGIPLTIPTIPVSIPSVSVSIPNVAVSTPAVTIPHLPTLGLTG
jgi:hypothetical protein